MHLFIFVVATCIVISDAFLFFAKERWLFCFKICPLYCSPRRYDEDAASSVYIDDHVPYYPPYPSYPSFPSGPSYPDPHEFGRSHYGYVICKPETTTTPKPTTTTTMATTTPEPSYLCMMCMKKCNDVDRKK